MDIRQPFERQIERRGVIHVPCSPLWDGATLPSVGGKPLIYYPLTAMIDAGIEEVAIVAPQAPRAALEALLGTGAHLGMTVHHITQAPGGGMARAPHLAREFLGGMPALLMPGDGIVSAARLSDILARAAPRLRGAAVLTAHAATGGEDISVIANGLGVVTRLDPRPDPVHDPLEDGAEVFTGVALLDARAPDFASWLPSSGATMIDLLGLYQSSGALCAARIGDGGIAMSVKTPSAAEDATRFVKGLERRRRGLFGSPELAALKAGRIEREDVARAARIWDDTAYGAALADALARRRGPRAPTDALRISAL